MAKETRRYAVEPGSDLAVLLRDAEREDAPVTLDTDGRSYRVVPDGASVPAPVPEGAIWQGYDADSVLAAFRAARGAFNGIDRQQLLADIQAQRGQDTHGRPA